MFKKPLSELLRPKTIDQFVGQKKLFQKGSLLNLIFSSGMVSSFIMWGPPGTGKTTVAEMIKKVTKHSFITFSAVLASIKEIKEVMKKADKNFKAYGNRTVIFIDEIHRFNRLQQDAFLPYIEKGTIILIGATTQNPSFEITDALLSRVHSVKFTSLDEEDIFILLKRGVKLSNRLDQIDDNILKYISKLSLGDARKGINILDIIIDNFESDTKINKDKIDLLMIDRGIKYDKKGEQHYNIASALQKSIRGSDPQASLYWLARMIEGGENPSYIIRRLIRIAVEDIGVSDPNALQQAIAAKEGVELLGMPEGDLILAQLVIYLSTAPKSNSIYEAYKKAKDDVLKTSHLEVPPYLVQNRLSKDGSKERYIYPFDKKFNYISQQYLPDRLKDKIYYTPSQFGFEKDIKKRVDWWNRLKSDQLVDKNTK